MKNTRNTFKIRNYTLVELLTVIAIISILAGLSMAGVSYARKQARITKAKADIASLVTAIKSYESTYRLLPVKAEEDETGKGKICGGYKSGETIEDDNSKNKTEAKEYDKIVQILAKRNIEGNWSEEKNKKNDGNRRGIKFLDVPQNFTERGFVDPWGNRYVIIFNSVYNEDGVKFDGKDLYGSVFVYSYGPNEIDDKGQNSANGGDKGTDDICSWK